MERTMECNSHLLLKNAVIFTVDAENRKYRQGDILIRGNEIVAIGDTGTLTVPSGAKIKDCSGYLLMPGLVNAHSHSQSALTKMMGSGDRTNTITALWYGFAHGENRTLQDITLSAQVHAIQMIESGCTLCIDQFNYGGTPRLEQVSAAIEGYLSTGMRCKLVYDMIDRTQDYILPETDTPIPELARQLASGKKALSLNELIEGFRKAAALCPEREGRITVVPGTPVPSMCTDQLLEMFPQLAKEYNTIFTCHMLEHFKERGLTQARWNMPEIAFLKKIDFLGPELNIAHCIWATDDEIRTLAQCGVSVTHCPELNIKLGGGIAKIRKMLNSGINVALGADSATNQIMFDVMKLTALIHRINQLNPEDWIFADEIIRMATIGGAKALGMDHEVGSLEPGKRADIIFLDLTTSRLCPTTDLPCRLVYTENGASVDAVMVDGEMIMEGRRLLRLDATETLRRAQLASDRLEQKNQELFRVADQMTEILNPEVRKLVNSEEVSHF